MNAVIPEIKTPILEIYLKSIISDLRYFAIGIDIVNSSNITRYDIERNLCPFLGKKGSWENSLVGLSNDVL